MKILGYVLILGSMAGMAYAGRIDAPEITASTGAAALTLVSGAMLVLRSRRAKR